MAGAHRVVLVEQAWRTALHHRIKAHLHGRRRLLRLLEAVLLLVLVLVSVHGFSSFVCWLEQLFERFPFGGYVRVH